MDGSLKWAVDVKLPGMVHARNVKPPVAGAKLISIDESSVRGLPGFIKVVSKGNYVAVVCEREEQAIKAARQLKVNWEKPATRAVPVIGRPLQLHAQRDAHVERAGRAWSGIPTRRWQARRRSSKPNTMSRSRGTRPSVRPMPLADPSNGQMTIYSNDMKSYGMRNGVAEFLGMPRDQVRVVWMEGPQGYGRTAADDAGFEAAFLAKEIGRPVRVQWMRNEETAWDTKGPAFTFKMRGGLDAQGNLVAFDYNAQAADYNHLGYNEPDTVLIAQLMGTRRATPAAGSAATPSDMYAIPNRRMATQVVSLPLVWETPLRTGNLRDPNGPQVDLRRRIVHRRAGGGGESRPGRVPPEAPHRRHHRRQRVQAGALHRRASRRRRRRIGWDTPSFAETARHRKHPHRARHRVRLPQPDRRRARSPRSR